MLSWPVGPISWSGGFGDQNATLQLTWTHRRADTSLPIASGPNRLHHQKFWVKFSVRGPLWPMKTMPKWTWWDFRLWITVCTYVLMYVKRLVFVYVCEGFSYLCVSVKVAIFVYIREPWLIFVHIRACELCICVCAYVLKRARIRVRLWRVFIFVCVCEDRLCACVCAYVLMYVRTYAHRYIHKYITTQLTGPCPEAKRAQYKQKLWIFSPGWSKAHESK